MRNKNRQDFAIIIGLVLCLQFVEGCDSRERRYRLSGTVTYNNAPVPAGYIVLEPEVAKGNSGGPGRARINDGKYDTRVYDSVGTIGGPHVVHIVGFDKKVTGSGVSEVALPKSLFHDFTVSEDLPKRDSRMDFHIK